MQTKKYLGQIDWYSRRIEFKINELQKLKEMSTLIKTASLDDMKVQSGTKENHMENTVIAIADTQREIEKLIETLISKKAQIVSEIEKMEDINEYSVLTMRYVECKTIREIASNMKYTEKNIERIHAKAIDNFTLLYGVEKGLTNEKVCKKCE